MWMRAAYLLEGLRLEAELQLPPLTLSPIPIEHGYVGRDGREIFNACLDQAGFVTRIGRPAWAVQFAPRRRLAHLTLPALEVGEVSASARSIAAAVRQVADLLSLSHGGSPQVLAGVTEISDGPGRAWRTLSIMAGSGAWPGSILARLAADDVPVDELDIEALWRRGNADARNTLWLSLYRGAVSEVRWDVRMFRLCSVLETIAREVIKDPPTLRDQSGAELLGHDGRPASASTARGVIYLLIRRSLEALELPSSLLLAHPTRDLWKEVGTWLDVRNAVAHEGHWPRPPAPSRSRSAQTRAVEAFDLAARGGGLDAGYLRYADCVHAGVEAVMRAAVLGHFSGLPQPRSTD
jgi:hypothetical protein